MPGAVVGVGAGTGDPVELLRFPPSREPRSVVVRVHRIGVREAQVLGSLGAVLRRARLDVRHHPQPPAVQRPEVLTWKSSTILHPWADALGTSRARPCPRYAAPRGACGRDTRTVRLRERPGVVREEAVHVLRSVDVERLADDPERLVGPHDDGSTGRQPEPLAGQEQNTRPPRRFSFSPPWCCTSSPTGSPTASSMRPVVRG